MRICDKSAHFLGHHISPEGFQPIPEKVLAIQNCPKSKAMTHLYRFLGMLNYYKRFISSCTEIARPLNSILLSTKSGKKLIKWSAEAETAFLEIKTKLSNAALFAFSAPEPETAIFADASATGCGGVLLQRIEDNWKPLCFFSQSFSSTQTHHATFDRELLAVYLAEKHFRYFIEGQKFTIFKDHAPFCKVLCSRSPNPFSRQQRHLDFTLNLQATYVMQKAKKIL